MEPLHEWESIAQLCWRESRSSESILDSTPKWAPLLSLQFVLKLLRELRTDNLSITFSDRLVCQSCFDSFDCQQSYSQSRLEPTEFAGLVRLASGLPLHRSHRKRKTRCSRYPQSRVATSAGWSLKEHSWLLFQIWIRGGIDMNAMMSSSGVGGMPVKRNP